MITGFKGSDKKIGFYSRGHSDCINRWILKRVAKRLMKSADMRKIKISFIDSEDFFDSEVLGHCFHYYKATSADGEVKYIQVDYKWNEGACYYECFKID